MTASPTYKVYAVLAKQYTDDKYVCLAKIDKSIDMSVCRFAEKIETLIEREKELVK